MIVDGLLVLELVRIFETGFVAAVFTLLLVFAIVFCFIPVDTFPLEETREAELCLAVDELLVLELVRVFETGFVAAVFTLLFVFATVFCFIPVDTFPLEETREAELCLAVDELLVLEDVFAGVFACLVVDIVFFVVVARTLDLEANDFVGVLTELQLFPTRDIAIMPLL